MGLEATKWVWRQSRATGIPKFVLLAIADHADKEGVAWPGVPRLAQMVGRSERTVQRCLEELELLGDLKREIHGANVPHRRRSYQSNLYRIPIGEVRTQNPFGKGRAVVTETTPLAQEMTHLTSSGDTSDPGGMTPVTPKSSAEPKGNLASSTSVNTPFDFTPSEEVPAQVGELRRLLKPS
jgi:hypothetical protein